MLKNHPQICLFQPEIPQNTGTTGRLAAATQCRLNLIRPFGFASDDRQLLRAGLDYWPYLDLEIYDDIDTLLTRFDSSEIAFFSKNADHDYDAIPDTCKLLVFGRETSGLPPELRNRYPESFYRIPMYHGGVRSLNLANSVAIVVYHLLMKKKANAK